ncbi:hypothetical protein [Piscicoccus intestinalis]|uniref:hypothetical protein n=1 Tax=Piscicoccus intestinalis TaxID=746033 RepID=UPI000838F6E2|nr:hypothetical protein [Piscicoccus intestinalis]
MIYTHPYAYASDHMEPSDFVSLQSVTMGVTAVVLFVTGIISGIVGVIALSGVTAVLAGGFSIVAAIKAVENAMEQTSENPEISEAPAPVHTPASL